MKQTTVVLYDMKGEELPAQTFPSAREAREAQAKNRADVLAALGWGTKHSATTPELASFLRGNQPFPGECYFCGRNSRGLPIKCSSKEHAELAPIAQKTIAAVIAKIERRAK